MNVPDEFTRRKKCGTLKYIPNKNFDKEMEATYSDCYKLLCRDEENLDEFETFSLIALEALYSGEIFSAFCGAFASGKVCMDRILKSWVEGGTLVHRETVDDLKEKLNHLEEAHYNRYKRQQEEKQKRISTYIQCKIDRKTDAAAFREIIIMEDGLLPDDTPTGRVLYNSKINKLRKWKSVNKDKIQRALADARGEKIPEPPIAPRYRVPKQKSITQ